jgi:hypothetical protein
LAKDTRRGERIVVVNRIESYSAGYGIVFVENVKTKRVSDVELAYFTRRYKPFVAVADLLGGAGVPEQEAKAA